MDLRPLRESADFRRLFFGEGISFFGSMVTCRDPISRSRNSPTPSSPSGSSGCWSSSPHPRRAVGRCYRGRGEQAHGRADL